MFCFLNINRFKEFERAMRPATAMGARVILALVGFGEEHSVALSVYRELARAYPSCVHALAIGSQSDARVISRSLLEAVLKE